MPGPLSRTATRNEPFDKRGLDRHLSLVGEFDRVADEIEQHLGEPAFVAMPGRQTGRYPGRQCEILLRRQRFDRDVNALHQIGERIIG